MALAGRGRPVAELQELLLELAVVGQSLQHVEVFKRLASDHSRRTESRRTLGDGSALVKTGHCFGQLVDLPWSECAAFDHPTGQAVLWELAHPDGVFDRGTSAIDPWSFRRTADGHDVQVQLGRQTLIQLQLQFATGAATLKCRVIEKVESNRFFDLVGALASEQDPRDVRFLHTQNVDSMRERFRPQ